MLAELWSKLPWDGRGWRDPADPLLRALSRRAAANYRRRVPSIARPFVFSAGRAAWLVAAYRRATAFARAMKLGTGERRQLFRDCLNAGADPIDAYIWRALFDECHPLPARAAAIALNTLGDPSAHRLLADKLATADLLESKGVRVPKLFGTIRPHADERALDFLDTAQGSLFVKPRRGFGGHGAFGVEALDGRQWRLEDGTVMDLQGLCAKLRQAASHEEILIQEYLRSSSVLPGNDDGKRPAVLRLTTAREPEGRPFVHSVVLVIPVPHRRPRDFLCGAIYVPVDPDDASLSGGLLFARARERLDTLPWNGAKLAGCKVPAFAEAVAAVLTAMDAIPPLPLVNWDMIPTDSGPVLLEGNTGGNWILTNLPAVYGLTRAPLVPLLARWLEVSSAHRPETLGA